MSKRKPKPKPKPPKYTWILSPGGVNCYTSPDGGQTVMALWEAETLSSFHDEVLAKATKEINAILRKLEDAKPSDKLEPGFIIVQDQLFLVWSSYDVISPHDDDEEIIKALGLKRSSSAGQAS